MSSERLTDRLHDIIDAARACGDYLELADGADELDAMLQSAIERELIRIGEAVRAIQESGIDLEKRIPAIPWGRIVGMRNRLVHEYKYVEPSIIRATVSDFLPDLVSACREFLDQPE